MPTLIDGATPYSDSDVLAGCRVLSVFAAWPVAVRDAAAGDSGKSICREGALPVKPCEAVPGTSDLSTAIAGATPVSNTDAGEG